MKSLKCDRGNASIEYALVAAAIGLGIVSALVASKRAQNLNLDKISYSISNAMEKNKAPKTVLREEYPDPYTANGTKINQKVIYYTDGTHDLFRTPEGTNQDYAYTIGTYDQYGRQMGTMTVFKDGRLSIGETTWLGPDTFVSKETGEGSCNCSVRSQTKVFKQADGSDIVVSYNDVVESSNIRAGMYQQYIGVYHSSPGVWEDVGFVITSPDGTVNRVGQDVSQYLW